MSSVLLAQATFTASELGVFIGILVFLLSGVIAARKVFGHEPPLHKEYASHTETEHLKSEINKLDGERRSSVANLHSKVDHEISALRTETNSRIERLEARIDAVPERTIKLLRETKDLI